METHDYENGFHARWEVYVHYLRDAARQTGSALTPQAEQRLLEDWLRVNRKRANESQRCESCTEEIAQARLEKRNPFQIPAAVKAAMITWSKRMAGGFKV